jgi:flagellar motility protein MotE (MotC chaperone)
VTLRTQRRIAVGGFLLCAGLVLRAFAATPADSAQPNAPAVPSESPPALDTAPQPSSKLLAELRKRNDELEVRERDLGERERSLGELAAEAKSMLAELDGRRGQVEGRIAVLEKLQGDGVARLAKVYGAMPPPRAAELLSRLDLEVASVLLSRMKPKVSASVMAAMDPEQALRVSERATLALEDVQPVGAAPSPAPSPAPPSEPGESADEAGRFR